MRHFIFTGLKKARFQEFERFEKRCNPRRRTLTGHIDKSCRTNSCSRNPIEKQRQIHNFAFRRYNVFTDINGKTSVLSKMRHLNKLATAKNVSYHKRNSYFASSVLQN